MLNKEFRNAFGGFFMGEGMFRISNQKRRGKDELKHPWYRPLVRITLRQDDEKVLDTICKKIGGHIFRRGIRDKILNKLTGQYTFSRPTTIWQVEDRKTCRKIAELVLKTPLPSKKKKEAIVMIKFIDFADKHYQRGKPYPSFVLKRFQEMEEQIKNLKRFNEK